MKILEINAIMKQDVVSTKKNYTLFGIDAFCLDASVYRYMKRFGYPGDVWTPTIIWRGKVSGGSMPIEYLWSRHENNKNK